MGCVASETGGDAAGLHWAGSVISGAQGQAAKRQLPLPSTLFGAVTARLIYLGNEAKRSAGLAGHRAVSVRVPVGCHRGGQPDWKALRRKQFSFSWRETEGGFPSETIKQHVCFAAVFHDSSGTLPLLSLPFPLSPPQQSPLAAEQIPVCQEEPLCRLPSYLPFLPCCTLGRLKISQWKYKVFLTAWFRSWQQVSSKTTKRRERWPAAVHLWITRPSP